ncbi:MAG TPA: RNA polymerase sigma factor [Kofleriaceae bacterium]|nr:RNA polymerase sigma factor [Kofleriaceae bacterium]
MPRARRPDPDRDLFDAVAAGDARAALRRLMNRHGNAVFRYCWTGLRDRCLAEDVHQQVFIEAFRDLPRFAGRSTVRTWLFGIARHRVLDAAKARTRNHAHVEVDSQADAPDPAPAPGEMLDRSRLLEAVAGCLAELDAKSRDAVVLRFQYGFTFEQMAEICGEKSGTLQVRVARALPVLRARLEQRIGDF